MTSSNNFTNKYLCKQVIKIVKAQHLLIFTKTEVNDVTEKITFSKFIELDFISSITTCRYLPP